MVSSQFASGVLEPWFSSAVDSQKYPEGGKVSPPLQNNRFPNSLLLRDAACPRTGNGLCCGGPVILRGDPARPLTDGAVSERDRRS
jgi:hypothetical protein